MVRNWIIVLALAAYAFVLGCVVWPSEPHALSSAAAGNASDATAPRRHTPSALVQSRDGLPYVAVAMQIQRVDWIDRYKQSMDEIASLGADSVLLVIDTRTEDIRSRRIWLDMRITPTPDKLAELIQHAKSRKLRVILMPIVLLDDPGDDWRGKIAPDSEQGGWEEWFDSYRNMITTFAWIAEGNGVDVLVVGSELVSTEKHTDQWRRTIAEVRKTYKGRLTYSSNWDHYTQVHFWDDLDLIGMNSYWKFGEKGTNEDPSLDYIMNRWSQIKPDVLSFVEKQNKPLLFLEIGWFSQANVAYEPWDYTQDKPINLTLQKKLYEAFFASWWGEPRLGGFCIWEWPPGDGGSEDGGYTPENKPAERLIREWLAKPRWKVK